MNSSKQSQRLLQIGVALFFASAVLGLFIPRFTVPRIALAAHLVGLLQGLFLVVLGLLWSRLDLNPTQSRIAFGLVVYQAIAAPFSNLLAGIWGAGNTIIPMAAGAAHGTAGQEIIITIGLRSAGAALLISLALMLWGLRRPPSA